MTREYKNGRYFSGYSKDFDNGYRHKNNSVKGIPEMAAVFQNGVHQRDFGFPKGEFQTIYDEYYLARASGFERFKAFLKIEEIDRKVREKR